MNVVLVPVIGYSYCDIVCIRNKLGNHYCGQYDDYTHDFSQAEYTL